MKEEEKIKEVIFETCKTCKGKRVVFVLGNGGDYEHWPCPDCRPEEFNKPDATEIPDGELNMKSVSIGYRRIIDNNFAILATLNNKDDLIPQSDFELMIIHVKILLSHHIDNIEILSREDTPDYIIIDENCHS